MKRTPFFLKLSFLPPTFGITPSLRRMIVLVDATLGLWIFLVCIIKSWESYILSHILIRDIQFWGKHEKKSPVELLLVLIVETCFCPAWVFTKSSKTLIHWMCVSELGRARPMLTINYIEAAVNAL